MTRQIVLVAGLLFTGLPLASLRAEPRAFLPPQPAPISGLPQTARIPLESMPGGLRDKVRSVLERPSLSAKGVPETFNTDIGVYHWLLEHPDLAVKLWRQQGSKVADIEKRGDVFRWDDEQGSEVLWHTALATPGTHIWFAEGKVKPALLVPMTSFRAIAVLHYTEGKDLDGKAAVQHQVHFLLRCDSRAISLATRILGASAPRMTEQYLGQLQMFYGGMAWFLSQDETRARRMYRKIGLTLPEDVQPVIPTSSPPGFTRGYITDHPSGVQPAQADPR